MAGRAMALALVFAMSAVSALAEANVYFWRDAGGRANYGDVCPAGVECTTSRAGLKKTLSTSSRDLLAATTSTDKSCRGNGKRKCEPAPTPAPEPSPTPAPEPTPEPLPTNPEPVSSNLRSPVGTNLDAVSYWSPQLPFVNVIKSSSPWISGDSATWDNGQPLDLDANGWVRSLAPGQIAKKLMLREIGDRYPAGVYTLRYQGEGNIGVGFAGRIVSQQPGELQIQVTPGDAGLLLVIDQTNPANYVRDIEITMPGGICQGDPFRHVLSAADCSTEQPYLAFADHHKTILFNPVFVSRLRAYSVLRFMDWMRTNNSPVRDWTQRTPLSYSTWDTAHGVPIEIMVALANVIGARPWFTLPHQADDAYVRNFAAVVKQLLRPELGVYVEHSNEVWNAMFAQYGYAVTQAAAQTPPVDNIQYHALRTRTMGQIFRDTLGASRVTTVLGAQVANPWTATHALEYLQSQAGASSALGVDAVAVAPYLGVSPTPQDADAYKSMTLDQFFAYVRNTVLPWSVTGTATYRGIADRFGLQLVAYEGGQHMVGVYGAESDATLNALFDSFNRDPRIKPLYYDYLAGWRQAGGELFVHFNDVGRYTKWGRWGALEYIAQPRTTAPKFDAIQTFIESNPVWWSQ